MKNVFIIIFATLLITFAIVVINQFFVVRRAHSSFENYYAFRGCTKLLKRTNSYGLCKLSSGKVIKLVHVQEKWYLDGDLPVCYWKFCL